MTQGNYYAVQTTRASYARESSGGVIIRKEERGHTPTPLSPDTGQLPMQNYGEDWVARLCGLAQAVVGNEVNKGRVLWVLNHYLEHCRGLRG
eukprot:COSAG06_NODE_4011_length_4663_cov_7.007230_2_plen_92_part_00